MSKVKEEELDLHDHHEKKQKKKHKHKQKDKKKHKKRHEDLDEEELADYGDSEEETLGKRKRKGGMDDPRPRKKKKNQKLKNPVLQFIDREAEEDDDEEDEFDDEAELDEKEAAKLEKQYYRDDELKQQNKGHQMLKTLINDVEHGRYDEDDEDMVEDEDAAIDGQHINEILQRNNLPTVSDAKLWLVKCKMGCERQIVLQLLNKYADMKQKGKPLSILSASCSDSVKQFIYVEAFKEVHVRTAI